MVEPALRQTALILVGLLLAPSFARAGDEDAATTRSFGRDVAPVLRQSCVGCHNATKTKGNLNLERIGDEASIAANLATWGKVLQAVEDGVMPPADQPALDDETSAHLVATLQGLVSKAGCLVNPDPGRVTLRRLNREEYNNTIRDLVGVDFRPADDFPADDVGYGFDSIGDVLTLPPLLLEKYLAAAERIARVAIVADEPPTGPVRVWKGERWATTNKDAPGYLDEATGGWLFATSAVAPVADAFPHRGTYRVRVHAFEQPAGPEPARIEVRVDGQTVQAFAVPARAESPGVYAVDIQRPEPGGRLDVAFVNDAYFPDEPDLNRRDRNLGLVRVEVEGPLVGKGFDLPTSHRAIVFATPDPARPGEAARAVVRRFSTRAFRRPSTDREVDRLAALVEGVVAEGDSFEQGVRLAVEAVLVSPHFLFRVELDQRPTAPRDLTDLELASRLSYFLWSSMPDDALRDRASRGELRDPAVLRAEVDRMLRDDRAAAMVENFSGQWLQTRTLKLVSPSLGRNTRFDEPLRAAMKREPELFFGAIVRENRSILDLLDSDFTFVNQRLAEHYGIPDVKGPEFRRVTLDDGRRGGVVTMASVLTVTSNPTRTSPVKRGKWILEEILGTPPPPPPPGISDLPDAKEGKLTGSVRQRMEKHRSDPNCASCHARMDPLGFSLDNFNAIGGWRDTEGRQPIDASGVLPSGQTFNGPKELKAILMGKKRQFAACLTEKMMTYALGRGLTAKDRCVVEAVADSTLADGGKIATMIGEIVTSDPFRKRGGEPDNSSSEGKAAP